MTRARSTLGFLGLPLSLGLMGFTSLSAQVDGSSFARTVFATGAGAAVRGGVAPPRPRGQVDLRLDVTQAHLMLDLLESIAEGRRDLDRLEAVMSAEGTELIVGQMNLARRASMPQYRTLLTGLMEGRKPDIEPVDSSARSRNGVQGLQEAWPRLVWALDHTEFLRQRVDELRGLDFYERALASASRYLPDPIEAPPRVFAVIGGRAGAAKIAPDRLYLDVLVYAYRDKDSVGFPTDTELIRTIGHETHHMGYRAYLDRKIESLELDPPGTLLFGFLTGLLSEGAATYLVSHDRNLAELQERSSTRDHLANHQDLIATSERVVQAIVDGEIRSVADYDEATQGLLGMWFHSAGAFMLGTIDEAGGLERVMAVVEDPGMLLAEYNRAVRRLGREGELRLFSDDLADGAARLLG